MILTGRFVRRKWGWYLTLLDRKNFKVKILRFHAGGQLSTQYHNYRKELWLFLNAGLSGSYWEINEQELHTYYAPIKTWVLEIQYGEKCEENDIVRVQ